jgi:hypothetical protein
MAHPLTPQEIDELAAQQAADLTAEQAADPAADPQPAPPVHPTLAYGAEGAELEKLINLLRVIGYHTNDVAQGTSHKLDESVLADVRAAQITLGVTEPATDIQGERVGPATWAALYAAAETKLEADETPAEEKQESAAADEPPAPSVA